MIHQLTDNSNFVTILAAKLQPLPSSLFVSFIHCFGPRISDTLVTGYQENRLLS